MDKITIYKNAIKSVLKRHHDLGKKNPVTYADEFESQLVLDDERGHYFILSVGWNDMRRIYGSTIHVDLKGEKVWVQRDHTDAAVAQELQEFGVQKEDIVLGFQAPYKRPFTEYATA